MKLENISAEIRPRTSWEALDLGIQMARTWYKPLYLTWLATSVPIFVILLLVSIKVPWLSFWWFWLFKPLVERGPLSVLSHGLLGSLPSVKQTLRLMPALLKPQWFATLTWRRFSLTRSFDLPVLQLENLNGRVRSDRLATLHRQGAGVSIWLTLFCWTVEIALACGVLGLVALLTPSEFDFGWEELLVADYWFKEYLLGGVVFLSASLVAPFYVAGGFSLYINRRSHLEAWDVEIQFRRLMNRVQSSATKKGASFTIKSVALMAVLGLGMLNDSSTWAADADNNSAPTAVKDEALEFPQSISKKQIQDVLDSDLFHRRVTEEQLDTEWLESWWESLSENEDEEIESESEWMKTMLGWIKNLGELSASFAGLVEIGLWALLLALVVIVVWKYNDWIARVLTLSPSKKKAKESTHLVFGMDISPNSLPDNVLDEAQALAERGQLRLAVSLFYRSVLSQMNDQLIQQLKPALASSDTEGDCLRKITLVADDGLMAFIESIVGKWQRLAYGHMSLTSAEFDAMCEQWREHFDNTAGAPEVRQ